MKRRRISLSLVLVALVSISGRISATVPELQQISPEAVLYSGSWHGERIAEAVNLLEVTMSDEQIDYLDQQAAIRGVNTRVLLTFAALNPNILSVEGDTWFKWVDGQITSLRSGLGPFPEVAPELGLQDGRKIQLDPNSIALGTWSLLQTLAANNTLAEPATDLGRFIQLYESAFGPLETGHKAENVTPFLIHPFFATLKGRGYFDHRYPTVDSGPLLGDDPLMVDYLGRINQVPYHSHDGDDFWIDVNSRIVAPVSGTIVWKDHQGVLINANSHPGYVIYIGHLNRVDVDFNQQVTRGETQIGLSGFANKISHIHLEVRHYGQQTDTMGWFGAGDDPCNSLSSQGGYGGCEPSSWLWMDEDSPEVSVDPITLFSDTFSDGDFLGWTVVDAPSTEAAPSNWGVVTAKGSLVLRQNSNIHTQSPPYEGTYVYAGENWWSDYHFSVEVEPDDNDGVFVLFRYQDENNYYRFIMDRERHYRRLERKVDGTYR